MLPVRGTVKLQDVTAAFSSAARTLRAGDDVVFKTVLFRDQNKKWTPFASVLRVGTEPMAADDLSETNAGPLKLVSVNGGTDEIATSDGLREFLNHWRTLVSPADGVGFQESVHVLRRPSLNEWCALPAWVFTLYTSASLGRAEVPAGPFFNPLTGFFALTVGDAAELWLHVPNLHGRESPQDGVDVILADARAWIAQLWREEDVIRMRVKGELAVELFFTAIATDFEGKRHHLRELVRNGEGALQLPRPMRAIEGFLVGADGFPYDQFSEDERGRSRDTSLLAAPVAYEGQTSRQLLHALERGEDEQTEFKEWIPTQREHEKSYELLKVISAFANTGGGVLYIGISDELEIKGTGRQLYEYGGGKVKEMTTLRAEYAMELKRVVGEGLSPPVQAQFEWVTHANLWVLRIEVPRSERPPHEIVERGEIYVRRGANCKRASPGELRTIFQTVESL